VEDIVTSKGSTLIPASIPASPRPRIVAAGGGEARIGGVELAADCAIAAFEPVCRPPRPTDERRQESRNGDTTKGRIASTTALSLQQEPYRLNRERYRFNEGPCPRPQKVVIGACAPIHPRVGQSGPPGCLIRAGLPLHGVESQDLQAFPTPNAWLKVR